MTLLQHPMPCTLSLLPIPGWRFARQSRQNQSTLEFFLVWEFIHKRTRRDSPAGNSGFDKNQHCVTAHKQKQLAYDISSNGRTKLAYMRLNMPTLCLNRLTCSTTIVDGLKDSDFDLKIARIATARHILVWRKFAKVSPYSPSMPL